AARSVSRTQVQVALLLQLAEADDTALIGLDETRQQILEVHGLRAHGIATGVERKSVLVQPGNSVLDLLVGAHLVEGLQGRAMDHQRDLDILRSANTLDV